MQRPSIRLSIILALGILLAPLTADSQPPGKKPREASSHPCSPMIPGLRATSTPSGTGCASWATSRAST